MIELRTPTQIEQMRPAGRFVAVGADRPAREAADVGVNLLELDALAHRMIRERGAESCYIDYHPSFGASPFGKVLCTSVNDAVLHGLPHDYVLQDGDLLSVDFAASVDGWVSDSALSRRRRHPARGGPRPDRGHRPRRSPPGSTPPARQPDRRHLRRDRRGRPGGRASDQPQFGGHGVGRTMHGDPHVAERRPPGPRLPAASRAW